MTIKLSPYLCGFRKNLNAQYSLAIENDRNLDKKIWIKDNTDEVILMTSQRLLTQ